MKNSRLIKVYDQNVNGNDMDESKLIQTLKDSGLTILKYVYSSLKGAYFMRVAGNYTGDIRIYNA